MTRFVVISLAAFVSVSAAVLASAQGEITQVLVGTPVTWSVDGTPVISFNVVAMIEED
jgi:plastocyanin